MLNIYAIIAHSPQEADRFDTEDALAVFADYVTDTMRGTYEPIYSPYPADAFAKRGGPYASLQFALRFAESLSAELPHLAGRVRWTNNREQTRTALVVVAPAGWFDTARRAVSEEEWAEQIRRADERGTWSA